MSSIVAKAFIKLDIDISGDEYVGDMGWNGDASTWL